MNMLGRTLILAALSMWVLTLGGCPSAATPDGNANDNASADTSNGNDNGSTDTGATTTGTTMAMAATTNNCRR